MCNEGWGGSDCSIEDDLPAVLGGPFLVTCDFGRGGSCDFLLISGTGFIESPALMCHYTVVMVSVPTQ